MKKTLAVLVFICLFASRSYCQTDTAFINHIVNNLKDYSEKHIREKAYLHFDKSYYAVGDTIYFKAYLTAGDEHRLSNISGVLHVDLIDQTSKITHSILLQAVQGLCWGDFALPDTLAPGRYRVRAYTHYMQKADYFDQPIFIGSDKKGITAEMRNPPVNGMADVQFFPEGGHLVTDIRSKVGFKAVGADGLGTPIRGSVVDNRNNIITTFESGFAGMGSFSLLPEQGLSYKVRYKLKDSVQHDVPLSGAETYGITLAVNTNDADLLKIAVLTNREYLKANHDKFVLVSVYAGGKFTYVRSKLDSYELDLQLPVAKYPSGVARVTLFNDSGLPLAERLVFIKNPEVNIPPVINANGVFLSPRGKVDISIQNNNISPDKSGNYSVSVVNEADMPGAKYPVSIYAYLLLISELKGYIENPDHYFDPNSPDARRNVDALMLTQGYRKFSWQQLENNTITDERRVPERSLTISGTVKSLNDKKPISNGAVNLFSPGGGPILTAQTDSNGRFKFPGVIANDTARLVISAETAKGKNTTLVKLDSPIPEEPVDKLIIPESPNPDMLPYLQNRQLQKNADLAYSPLKGKLLKEVKIKTYRSSNYGGAGHADQVLDLTKENIAGSLPDVVNGRLNGVYFRNGGAYLAGFSTKPMLVVVDGVQIEAILDTSGAIKNSILENMNVRDVATVEVLKYANATIYGNSGGNGILVITTKQGENRNFDSGPATGMLYFKPHGFYLAREFYSPKYLPGFASAKPDLRSTIFWAPNLQTDATGKAVFSYYNADGTGTYRITLEGVDNNGNLGHVVYGYTVK